MQRSRLIDDEAGDTAHEDDEDDSDGVARVDAMRMPMAIDTRVAPAARRRTLPTRTRASKAKVS